MYSVFYCISDESIKYNWYSISNEGILIACWGLSKKTKYITDENVKGKIPDIDGVNFDCDLIKEMINHLDSPYYDGQYLK